MSDTESNLSLYLAHRRELVDYATAIVGDRARAEDLVQEAFLRFRSSIGGRQLDEPVGYLKRITRNLAIDALRSSAAERRRIDGDASFDSVIEDRPSQEEVLGHRDDLRVVMAAMAELPERTRVALSMHRLDGMKLKDVAEHLGVSVALVHQLVYDGLAHCRKRLREKS